MKELGQRLLRVMKILVPVDGSPASIRAVKLAIDQAKVGRRRGDHATAMD
jgi:nucleotide-binding universal stress UspA family protein